MSNLIEFYSLNNITNFEGYSQQVPGQIIFLKDIVKQKSVLNVMEIGFNAGHSAELFLSSNPQINLVSFDIGIHNYVKYGKAFIDKKYPNRHELIIGNSLKTIPLYSKKYDNKFDLIFIDGGHSYEVAKNDLLNCKNLSHEKTLIIMDDTMNNNNWIKHWNNGPNKAWNEAKENGLIKEVGTADYRRGRGQSWGYYIFNN